MEHFVNPQTQILVVVFFFIYVAYFLRRVARHELDLYDFFLLSLVAIIPTFFVLFPAFVASVTHLVGVTFPFVILFGLLFLALFLIVYVLIRRINRLSKRIIQLTQEIAMLGDTRER